MIRGGLVALIFQKTLELDSTKASEGDAISLISADIEGIEPGISLIHEVWASIIELGIALCGDIQTARACHGAEVRVRLIPHAHGDVLGLGRAVRERASRSR